MEELTIDHLSIETFLAIVDTGSISLAAEKLFLSQTTVGYRLKKLEEELGIHLIIRKKGQRTIELTPKGEVFIGIANNFLSLWEETEFLSQKEAIIRLSIGCVDILNTYIFPNFYKKIIQKNPAIKLFIKTFHSSELNDMLDNRIIDIAYVFDYIPNKNIIAKEIYKEPLFVITQTNSIYAGDSIHPSQLNPEDEISIMWSETYKRWHNTWWPDPELAYIQVNTGSMIFNYFDNDKSWAIVPLSVINTFKKTNDINIYSIEDVDVPELTCYQLTQQFPQSSHVSAISKFEELLLEFIQTDSNFHKIGNL